MWSAWGSFGKAHTNTFESRIRQRRFWQRLRNSYSYIASWRSNWKYATRWLSAKTLWSGHYSGEWCFIVAHFERAGQENKTNTIFLIICRTTAKEKKPSYSRDIITHLFFRRLWFSEPPFLFAFQELSTTQKATSTAARWRDLPCHHCFCIVHRFLTFHTCQKKPCLLVALFYPSSRSHISIS